MTGSTIPQLLEVLREKYNSPKLSEYLVRKACNTLEIQGATVRRIRRTRVISARLAGLIERELLATHILHKPAAAGSETNV
jgi:ABC-type microcin C transport system permease subunit YejB